MTRSDRNEQGYGLADDRRTHSGTHGDIWPPYISIPFIIGLSIVVWVIIVQTGIALF